MATSGSTLPTVGRFCRRSVPSVKTVNWDVYQYMRFLKEKGIPEKDFKSDDFSFEGATWSLFVLYDSRKSQYRFGINVQNHSNAVLACFCSISCEDIYNRLIEESSESYFICEKTDSHSEEVFSLWDLNGYTGKTFSECGAFLVCKISVQKYTIRKANSQAEISHSSRSSDVEVQAPMQIDTPEIEEEDLSTTSFDSIVCQDFKNFLLSEEFSDVTIKIGDQKFKAHWSILAARSSVFASMLRHDTKEKASGVVDVEDCEPSSFPVFLEYVYCGSTEKISSENVFNLYASADKYDVQDLRRKCLEFMTTNLSVDSFCETLHLSLQHLDKKLLKLATEFFIRNFQEIILTSKWQAFLSEHPVQGNELFIKAAKTF